MDIHLRCPPPPRGARVGDQVARRLAALPARSSVPSLERLLAVDFIGRQPAGKAPPFERFLERPAVEPILARKWNQLKGPMDPALAASLIGDLTGTPPEPRGTVAASVFDRAGVRSVYADPDHARGWADRVSEAEPKIKSPFIRACHAYAEVALSHPFADGNGRLARVMFTRALARAGWLSGPVLPLGPLIYRHHRRVIDALVILGTTGDWRPTSAVMEALSLDALAFARHVMVEPDQAPHVGEP